MKSKKELRLNSLVDKYIIGTIFVSILIINSFKILSRIFSYGFLRKEVLTDKSNIGFDIKIKM